jgi:SAM-dependent methyltransferase
MTPTGVSKQTDASIEKNVSFFRDNLQDYSASIEVLDTYRNIRAFANEALSGVGRLLDVGNGGTFDYDVRLVRELVAVDLFLEDLASTSFPKNVRVKNGCALDLPEPDESFDAVIFSMLMHHLVGKTVDESVANITRAIAEAFRVLKPGGRLIIIESCVPEWFYAFERVVFPLAAKVIGVLSQHPLTLQYPPATITGMLRRHADRTECIAIPAGRWILQFGRKYPSALTPARPYRLLAHKR